MANYLKPQSPLSKGGDYIYPLTVIDQIIRKDGTTRLNEDTMLFLDNSNGEPGEAPTINADTLNGYTVETLPYPVHSVNGLTEAVSLTASDVGALGATETAVNSSKFDGVTKIEFETNLINLIHPIGSSVTLYQNVEPTVLYGGTWELVASTLPYFAKSIDQDNDANGFFTSDVVDTYAFYIRHYDNILYCRASLTVSAELSSTNVTLGTIDFSTLGIIANNHNHYLVGYCDGGQAGVMITIANGEIIAINTIGPTSIASGKVVRFEFTEFLSPAKTTYDASKVESWTWKRVA